MGEHKLRVLLHGRPLGWLTPAKNGAAFCFDEDVAEAKLGSPLLSTALLVQEQRFDTATTQSWFSGLLPEDSRFEQVRRFFGIEDSSYVSVLAQVGWECAGAVAVVPSTVNIPACTVSDVQWISSGELVSRLGALPSHPYDSAATLRISLGGYQEKLCIVADENCAVSGGKTRLETIGLPLNGGLSTHILKPQPERFPGMIEGEAWAMAAAAYVTPTAKTALLDLSGAPMTLVVKRFDRVRKKGELSRIHQEDCAQAMGLSSHQKYAASGSPKKSDPSFRRIAALLSRFANDPTEEQEQLLLQMCVNVCLGNTDAHAKNFALLHPDESTVSLAPMYDVVPATEITPKVVAMGMRIDGRIRIDRIEFEQIENEARSWGLSASRIKRLVGDAAEKLAEGIVLASEMYPQAGKRHAPAALRRIEALRP